MRTVRRWLGLTAVTVAATAGLGALGVPSAGLFAALVVGIALALAGLAPARVPRPAGLAAQGVLGVYIGTMVRPDSLASVGAHWPIVTAVVLATLAVSVAGGALLGLHRDVTPLTGALALTAGGASGLVAIARELGGDVRMVAVVQYVRVGLITASMPVVVTLVFRPDLGHPADQPDAAPDGAAPAWFVSLALVALLAAVGIALGRLVRLPGAGLLGPLAVTVGLELAGLSMGVWVPALAVQVAYVVIGWQAGLAFTRESLRAVGRALPLALTLIVGLSVAAAGLGVLLARVSGCTLLEGYLATSPGGIYAVLATAVDTGSNVTFIVGAQVLRVLAMLFAAPVIARVVVAVTGGRRASQPGDHRGEQLAHRGR
ncbi:AbrB family transcriptional regulator [Mycolicibacterium palauense]|uniref:AbrB family transcriptional regulator n=1 Tax=Mycolicibacterium palauense TaxID=2034511 RepID=UPI000BFEAD1F